MEKKYKIAVASKEGLLVDLHFGYTTCFAIYQGNEKGMDLIEKRQVEKYCAGEAECLDEEKRKEKILNTFNDCDGILVMRIGYSPQKQLEEKGVLVLEWPSTVEEGLKLALKKLRRNKDE